jgi:uncharacterized membrane protein YdbT with pleckstrin-like domain
MGAAFCARCGTRLFAPKPASVREFRLATIRPSYLAYGRAFLASFALIGFGAYLLYANHDQWRPAFALMAVGVLFFALAMLARRAVSWSVTSDRVIEQRGILASRRREMELADIRSVEIDRRLVQRLVGLGDVMIASAASGDFMIRLNDIMDPEAVAETVRAARLKRLA